MKKLLILAAAVLFVSANAFAHSNPNISVKNNTKDFTMVLTYTTPGHKNSRTLKVGPNGVKNFGSRAVSIQSLTVLKHRTSRPYGQKCTQLERGQTFNGVSIELNSLLKSNPMERDLKPIVTCQLK